MRAPLFLYEHGELAPPEDGLELVSLAVSAAQEVVLLWARPDELAALTSVKEAPGQARFPDSRTAGEAGVVATVHVPGQVRVAARILRLPVAHPLVDLMPDGEVLLVGARAEWTPEGAERNALLYDERGSLVREETLGDGIGHVQTTSAGDVWVGYFDEGVYGNYGWGDPGPAPVGAAGIVRFDRHLQQAWSYEPGEALGGVDDCTVLNVTDNAVWACYYSDFPVVRIRGEKVSGWTSTVGAVGAMVAAEDEVGLFGGYGDDRHRLVRGRLREGRFVPESVSRLVLPDGQDLPRDATILARGEHLHAVLGGRWLRADPLG